MNVPTSFPATGADMAVSITRRVTHQRIGLRLDFDRSRLDAGRLRDAVRLSLEAQPLLGCRFAVEGRRAVWRRLEHPERTEFFEVADTDSIDERMSAFHATEVPDSGPQVRVILLRGSDGDHVGIKLSHILVDGQSAKQYAYLLAEIYTKLSRDPSYVPEPDLRPRATAKDVWNSLTTDQRKAAKRAKSWTTPTWTFPAKGSSGLGLTYRAAFLEPDEFLEMKRYGQLRGATVNQMLLTAVFRSCVDMFDPPYKIGLSLMCTADLRRYLPDPVALPVSGVSISGSLDLPREDGEGFDDTLSRIGQRMTIWQDQCYGAAPAFAAERMAGMGYGVTEWLLTKAFKLGGGSGKSYPWFTNIGVIDENRLGFSELTPTGACMFGPSPRGAGVVPVISTYRDRLAICVGYCEADMEEAVIADFLRSVVLELISSTAVAPVRNAVTCGNSVLQQTL